MNKKHYHDTSPNGGIDQKDKSSSRILGGFLTAEKLKRKNGW